MYVAVDYHDIPRYVQKKRDWKPRKKKCDDVERLVHSKKQYGTHCFHRVLSADIVGDEKFTVYFEPILTDYDQGKISLSLIKNVKRTIRMKAMLMGRGFFSGGYDCSFIRTSCAFCYQSYSNKTGQTMCTGVQEES